jgi:ABC-type phosphate/phosphonate transport system ATPase subunit
MLKLIIGVKGTGKTKTLIGLVNEAVEKSQGSVICIEKGDKLRYDVKYQARLINTNEYFVDDAQALFGFVAGILASNHDVTDLFIDSALKICQNDGEAFDKFLDEMNVLTEKLGINVVMTSSLATENASDTVKKYL